MIAISTATEAGAETETATETGATDAPTGTTGAGIGDLGTTRTDITDQTEETGGETLTTKVDLTTNDAVTTTRTEVTTHVVLTKVNKTSPLMHAAETTDVKVARVNRGHREMNEVIKTIGIVLDETGIGSLDGARLRKQKLRATGRAKSRRRLRQPPFRLPATSPPVPSPARPPTLLVKMNKLYKLRSATAFLHTKLNLKKASSLLKIAWIVMKLPA